MRLPGLFVLSLACGCGHVGFDELAAPADGAPPDDTPIDAPASSLACGSAARFAIASASRLAIAVAPTDDGYRVFTSDIDLGQVRGSSFKFLGPGAAAVLDAAHTDVEIATSSAGELAALALGNDALVAMPYGAKQVATGTSLIPLDRDLQPIGTPVQRDGWSAGAGSLALSESGQIAVVIQNIANGGVDAQIVSTAGADAGSATHVDSSGSASSPTLVGSGGFIALWSKTAQPPNQIRAVALDGQIQPTGDAATIADGADLDASSVVRAAYLGSADRYLFTWTVKTGNGDEVWVSLATGALTAVGQPVLLSRGFASRVAAGADGFLVAWNNDTDAPGLHAARLPVTDGKVDSMQLMNVQSSGGTPLAWDVVSRAGQTVLAWVEAGGSGPNLWFDPLCAP